MAKFYIFATINQSVESTAPDGSPILKTTYNGQTPVLAGKDMKKFVQNLGGLNVDWKLFELNEVSYTIGTKTVPVDVLDLNIGVPLP